MSPPLGMKQQPAAPDLSATLASGRWLIWLLAVPVLALLAFLMAAQVRQQRSAAEAAIERRHEERVRALYNLARPAIEHVHDLRVRMEQAWARPPALDADLAAALVPRLLDGRPDGYTLDGAVEPLRARYGQLLWYAPDGSAPAAEQLRRAQAFLEHARPAHARAAGFTASWWLPTGTAMSVGYPWFDSATSLKSLNEQALIALAAYRARGDAERRGLAEREPRRHSYWSPPYFDDASGMLTVSHAGLVRVDGQYRGEVMLDFRLDDLQTLLAGWRELPGRHWIVDERQRVLADSAQPIGPARRPESGPALKVALADRLPAGIEIAMVDAALRQPGLLVRHGDWALVAGSAPGSPWTLVQALPASALDAQLGPTLKPYMLIAAALLLVFVAGQLLLSRRFVQPAAQVLSYLRALSRDAAAAPPRLDARWHPWVEAVTATFRSLREAVQRERRSEALKAAITDHALVALISADEDGHVVDFNPAAEAMFGLGRAQAIGRPVGELIVPERHRAAHEAGMARMRAGGAPRVMGKLLDLEAVRADGREFPVEMRLWRTEVDGVTHYTASLADVTERRAQAEQIDRQREALRQSEKLTAMGSLLAGVAHELNNPLAIVMGRASLLEAKAGGGELASDAQRIREAADRCGRIVRTFLAMARSRPVQRAEVQLNDLVRAAVELLQCGFRSHGIEVAVELAAGLPPVHADADQLGQVVLNLLVNVQHALAGAPAPRRVRVETGLEAPRAGRPQRAWLRVADNGPGVPEALRERIFDPFFTTKAEGVGTGLGLSVSRSIVREHGGELQLEARTPIAERGASFRMSLPPIGAVGPADAAPLPSTDAFDVDASMARVLVVDDEAELGELMREMLESARYEVAVAESGAVALELLGEARFDAIVCDLRMPDMDGPALWRAVRERDPALARRMVFVTGDTLAAGAAGFLAESGCACVEKPFAPPELLARVARALDGAAARG
ncbi:MAG TPA: PAS domain S-box protein [Methylibium sp.]|nr:PAS domain S-box protein [Methylibium sp.]